MDANIEALQAQNPAQYDYLTSFTIDPVTGEQGSRMPKSTCCIRNAGSRQKRRQVDGRFSKSKHGSTNSNTNKSVSRVRLKE